MQVGHSSKTTVRKALGKGSPHKATDGLDLVASRKSIIVPDPGQQTKAWDQD